MRIRIILACGLALSLLGRAFGQEVLSPLDSSAPTGSEVGGLDFRPQEAMTFAPSNDDGWFTADFLFGWIQGANLPRLVTSSPTSPVLTPKADAGVIAPGNTTSILLSGPVNRGVVPGFRLGGGYMYDKEYGLGVEAGFTFLPSQSSSFFFTSDNPANTILARPYVDATTGDPAAALVAFPDDPVTPLPVNEQITGNISVTAKNGNFYGVNFDLSERIGDHAGQRWDALFGYRFAYFSDALRIRQHSVFPMNLSGVNVVDRFDDFSSQNVFHGLDLGFRSTYTGNQWSLSLLGKFSPGNMSRTVDIHGRTARTYFTGATDSTPAGLYALSSNSGSHKSHKWTVVPELGANLNWNLRPNLALRLGYSALLLPKVSRADDQIDFNINTDLIGAPANPTATPQSPAFQSQQSYLLIQTLNLGVDLTF